MLLALGVDSCSAIERALEPTERSMHERSLAVEYARHVSSERLDEQNDEDAEENDLSDADGVH
jgi:hypothetical protein